MLRWWWCYLGCYPWTLTMLRRRGWRGWWWHNGSHARPTRRALGCRWWRPRSVNFHWLLLQLFRWPQLLHRPCHCSTTNASISIKLCKYHAQPHPLLTPSAISVCPSGGRSGGDAGPTSNGSAVTVSNEADSKKASVDRIHLVVNRRNVSIAREQVTNLGDWSERIKSSHNYSRWWPRPNGSGFIIRIRFEGIG